jgi:hypothetical protein
MVAGSRLSIRSVWNAPLAPTLCSADAMNQLAEYSLSPPRGPDSWVSTRKAVPMNMVFQLPGCVMIIGIGQDAGFAAVPDASFIRNIPAGFISPMFIPGMFIPGMD